MDRNGPLGRALIEAELEALIDIFASHDIDENTALSLSEDDLKEAGLTLGQRKRFLATRAAMLETAVREPAPAASERRQLTVLFCDLVGSTELGARLDPEDMRLIIQEYLRTCASVIQAHGGHVSQTSGDGVMAFFGYPTAGEDDAERAVRAGMALIGAIQAIKTGVQVKLNARVGVATGDVVIGGNEDGIVSSNEFIVGATTNLAARLQALAGPGEVCAAQETRNLVAGRFEFEALGKVDLKGFDKPRQVFRVVSEHETRSRYEAQAAGVSHPFVGRETELATLEELFRKASVGQGQAALIEAPAGMGKSRLCQSVAQMSGASGMEWQCSQHLINRALHPIAREVERAAGVNRAEPNESRLGKVANLIESTPGWGAEDHPFIADLLGIEVADAPPLDAMTKSRRTTEALMRRIKGAAEGDGPLLLTLEDAHWSDHVTRDFLAELLVEITDLPVLAMITSRTGFDAPAAMKDRATHIELKHLTNEAAYPLIDGVLGERRMPNALKNWILQKTDGVPLFIEELTKTILDALPNSGDALTVEIMDRLSIPTTLRDSLMSRLDSVGDAKRVAQLGAVIGREFTQEMLDAIAPRGIDTGQSLRMLTDAQLLLKGSVNGPDFYMFNHALVQDTAYETLLRTDRKQIHHSLARAMLDGSDAFGAQEPEIIARHCDLGDLPKEAVDHWGQAGRQAQSRAANMEAVNHFNAALRRLEDLPEGPDRDRQELDIQMALMPACMTTFGWGAVEVERACQRSHELGEQLGDGAAMFGSKWGLWTNYYLRGDMDRALETGIILRYMADAAQPNPMLTVASAHALSYCHYSRGEIDEGLEAAETGLALFDLELERQIVQLFQLSSGVALYAVHAALCWQAGKLQEGRASARRGVEAAEALDHPPSLVQALGVAGWPLLFDQNWDELKADLGRAAQLCEDHHLYFMGPFCHTHLNVAEAATGDHEAGIRAVDESLRQMRSSGSLLLQSQFEFAAAAAELAAGNPKAALARLERAGPEAAARGERIMMAECHRLRGAALLQLGDGEKARAALTLAISEAERRNAEVLRSRALLDMESLKGV